VGRRYRNSTGTWPGLMEWVGRIGSSVHWNPRVHTFIVVVALANAALYHGPVFSFALAHADRASFSGVMILANVLFLVSFFTILFLSLLSLVSERLVKAVCMLAAPCNALALYFVQTYGVILDKTMMSNVLNTDLAEAGSLFHPKLLLYLVLLGAVPCWFLSKVQIQRTAWPARLKFPLVVLMFGVGWMYANGRAWFWIDRNFKQLGGATMPWSYTVNASRYGLDRFSASRHQTLLPAAHFGSDDPAIVVLVIGESARAQNFSLYGYKRDTNPLLEQAGVYALPHSHSCATYTTASVRCMLSHVSPGALASYEPLPSYLHREGVDVIWRSRNFGEPHMKIDSYQHAGDLRTDCKGSDCEYDEVLLAGLEKRIRSSTRKRIFIVLHQHGSHGPSYYSLYPKRFEVFKPVCESVDLSQCTSAGLINAYDNSILYTDYFLHRAISVLKDFPKTPSVLMYVSDHGESLGEYGLYLHGTPYSIAPDFQKDVPFLVWMSDAFKQKKGISKAQLAPQATHSQANVFHSVMGAFDMRSEIYDRNLDIFSAASR